MKFIDDKFIVKGMFETLIHLEKDEWDMVSSNLEKVQFDKNDIILKPGEVEDYLYFITVGVIRYFFYSNLKQEYTLGFRSSPSAFSAYTSFIKREPSNVGTIAMSKVVAYRVSFNTLEKLYSLSNKIEVLSRRFLQYAYVEKEEKEFNLMSKTASEFYIDFCDNFPEIVANVPQKYIASYMGIAPESLSRIKSEIKKNKNKC
jgi:CRP-like cAMP-binding protein